jgi:hypothetical protein
MRAVTRRRGLALGVAAIISAVATPTARADDFSDIVSAVEGDLTSGQDAFTLAGTEFAGNQLTAGLTSLFDGIDDDGLSAPYNGVVGTLEALTDQPIQGSSSWALTTPADFADAWSVAQADVSGGESYLSQVAMLIADGNYGGALQLDLIGSDFVSVIPLEELLLGAAASV